MKALLGTKVGMTAVFSEDGRQLPVTVISTNGNRVIGKRTVEQDGYSALIIGYGDRRVDRSTRPVAGFYQKNDLVEEREGRQYIKRHVREVRLSDEELAGYEVGAELQAGETFNADEIIDVVGTSKGRGFTGVMKRHNFRGGKATHGVHEYYRHGGSIGSNTTPARCFKNRKMPGQHGNRRTTIQNLRIVDVIAEEGLILVRGSVPGPNGGLVQVKTAVKG